MKFTKYLFFIILIKMMTSSFGQTPYYDALEIKNLGDTKIVANKAQPIYSLGKQNELLSVIAKYLPKAQKEVLIDKINRLDRLEKQYSIKPEEGLKNEIDQLKDEIPKIITSEFDGNPFIVFGTTLQDGVSILPGFGIDNKPFSEVLGANVTSVADALTQHIITSAKEELNIAFFRKFKKFSEVNPEFRTLFPETANVLEDLLDYQYNRMLPILQDAFKQDVNNMVFQLDDLLELSRFEKVNEKFPELYIIIEVLQIADGLRNEKNAADILNRLATLDSWKKHWGTFRKETKEFYEVLALGNIISTALRSNQEGVIWISKNELYTLMKDTVSRQIFLGLVYQQIRNAQMSDGNILPKALETFSNITQDDLFKEFLNLSDEVTASIKDIKKLKDEKKEPSDEQIYQFIANSIRLVRFGEAACSRLSPQTKLDDFYIDLLEDLNRAYRAYYQKNYTVSILYATNAFSSFLDSLEFDKNKLKFVEKSLNYALFIAELAEAETADEAKAVIEAVALPAGSSSLKKYQNFNVNASSYLGASYRLNSIDVVNRSWDKVWNVTMPIGIGLNKGLGKGGSLSLNANVFDLGAIAEFRLKEDTMGNKSLNEKIVLGNILSPGLMLNYGIGYDIPLALGFGCQWGPGLRSIDEEDGQTFNKIYGSDLRWVLTLAVDVPLLNIHNGKNRRPSKK